MERHSAVIAFVATIVYMSMFLSYGLLEINNVWYDFVFLIVLIVLVLSLLSYGVAYTVRELKDI